MVNQEALRWIDRDRQHRFFAFINYFDVHDPYGAPRNYQKPAWSLDGSIDRYNAGVRYVDDQIGRLMQALEERGLLKDTLVAITSDHGESLGQHGLTYHAQALYRELIHVPLVIWYPGHAPAGVRLSTPVTNAAIPATIMDLVGKSESEMMFPGPPLTALWRGNETGPAWPDPLSEMEHDKTAGKLVPTAYGGSMKSLVTPQWHLITHEKLNNQLYDWARDPAETNNLINTPEGQAVAQTLASQLRARLAGSAVTRVLRVPVSPDHGTTASTRAR